jgi:hypothetical protein
MRVSVFVFLYRVIVKKLDRQECWKEVLKIWQPDDTWQSFIDHMLVKIQPPEGDMDWQFTWHG